MAPHSRLTPDTLTPDTLTPRLRSRSARKALASEGVFLEKKGVTVTQSRFVVSGQTHVLQGITSVRVGTFNHHYEAERFWPIALMGIAGLFAVGSVVLLFSDGDLAAGLLGGPFWGAVALGGYVWYKEKGESRSWTTYGLMLTTSSGESVVLEDEDEEWVSQVFNAVNEAISARG